MTKSIRIYGNSDELTTILVQTSVNLGSLKTFSNEVGIIQCQWFNPLEHPSASLEVNSHPVHGLIHEGT